MSRTRKDVPWKHRDVENARNYGRCLHEESQRYLEIPGVYRKKRRSSIDTEWHWMTTPSWWTRMMMNRPQRRKGSLWEREIVKCSDYDQLEDIDIPGVSRRPHVYFW